MKLLGIQAMLTWRRIYSHYVTKSARKLFKKHGVKPEHRFKDVKGKTMLAYSKLINSYPYKSDPLQGRMDFTYLDPDMFFIPREEARDCDDFAHMWQLWCEENGYIATQYYVYDWIKGHEAHMTCVAKKDGKYWLLDYTPTGPSDTIEGAWEVLIEKYNYDRDKFFFLKYM
jgi:hypothetical protein